MLSPDLHIQAPDLVQNYNRYSYVLNNPLIYTDPDGEFWHLIIGAALQGAFTNGLLYASSLNGNAWDWNQFGKSLIVGAISGAFSGGAEILTQNLNVVGMIPGALTHGAIQGLAGGLGGGFGNAIIENNRSAFGSGFKQGFIQGSIQGIIYGAKSGYRNAEDFGANLWSGKLYRNEVTSATTLKENIPLQPQSDRYCYAYAAAYADSGHRDRVAATFIDAADGAYGADAGQVFLSIDENSFNFSREINGQEWDNVRGRLLMRDEILGSIKKGETNHWVNITSITTADKLKVFGGGWKRVLLSTNIWDPISGHITNYKGSFISVVSLY